MTVPSRRAFHDQGGQRGREADRLHAAVGIGSSRFARPAEGRRLFAMKPTATAAKREPKGLCGCTGARK